MPDYQKKTVAELTEILKGRSLPHSGKKAELIARLNEADKAAKASEGMRDPNDFSITATPRQNYSDVLSKENTTRSNMIANTPVYSRSRAGAHIRTRRGGACCSS
jgi:hypothetical protein